MIKRKNGSVIYSFNVPREMIESMKWEKGKETEITADVSPPGKLTIIG